MGLKIEDYALIGDCETAALVGNNGSIDWLCWPSFSSNACFAALLGGKSKGYWSIQPEGKWKSKRQYRDHTLILETTFECKEGAVRLIDFMPTRDENSDVVRIVEGLRGHVRMRMELSLRFDYGQTVPWVTSIRNGVRAVGGPGLTVLRSSEETHGEKMMTVSEFTVSKGERKWFTLTYGKSHLADPPGPNPERALRATEKYWVEWTSRNRRDGKYAAMIERSLITLKALTYQPTGGVVAAP